MKGKGVSACSAVRVIGAACDRFDVSGLWAAEASGPNGWEQATLSSRRLAVALAGVAREAARNSTDVAEAGCSVGTLCGFAHVAESIQVRLTTRGPAWLDPEAFMYYPAHVIAGLVSQRLGLTGAATTFLGPTAGEDALKHAIRSIELGRHALHLAGAYEVVTPAAAERLEELGTHTDPNWASAAFILIFASGHAAPQDISLALRSSDRYRRLLADVLGDGWPSTLAPFVAIGTTWQSGSDEVGSDANDSARCACVRPVPSSQLAGSP
jgi:hypothetical protein